MPKTTRQKILEVIQRNQALSTQEIGMILGLTNADIRHHLVSLKNDSLVEIVGRRQVSRGAPTNIYGLSEQSFGNGLEFLSTILLEELVDQVSESEQRRRLRALATRLVIKISAGRNGAGPHQLMELTEKLNEIHFLAHWQAGAIGAQIIFHRCPYSHIIDTIPQLCWLDTFILEEYFGKQVEQLEKLKLTKMGIRQCVFQIQDKYPET